PPPLLHTCRRLRTRPGRALPLRHPGHFAAGRAAPPGRATCDLCSFCHLLLGSLPDAPRRRFVFDGANDVSVALIGRSEEHATVQAFLSDVLEGPAALVLAGEPGIGKTVVWAACLAEAAQDFGCVLSHRGLEAEATLSFAGLSDLLEPVFDRTAARLP